MKNLVRKIIKAFILLFCKLRGVNAPEGRLALYYYGHRNAIGGYWNEMGKLQYNFLLEQGLKPEQILMDIGCGSLRGGSHFIKYLNAGHYLGTDKNKSWVEAGIQKELGEDLYEEKKPEFVISDKFEFIKFSQKPDYAIAQSLFSHLRLEDIALCLKNLREHVNPGCRFFATFLESHEEKTYRLKSHSHRNFHYTNQQMCELGKNYGWDPKYIGDWNHPYGQKMIELIAV